MGQAVRKRIGCRQGWLPPAVSHDRCARSATGNRLAGEDRRRAIALVLGGTPKRFEHQWCFRSGRLRREQ